MSRLSTTHTPLGKTCAEIASLARILGAGQASASVVNTLKSQLDEQMRRLEAHLAPAVSPAPAALA